MKNFNHYAGREEFSAFKDFFLTHGQCKEMKKKEYFTTEDTSILSVILLPESM